jgi:hypothetical protein
MLKNPAGTSGRRVLLIIGLTVFIVWILVEEPAPSTYTNTPAAQVSDGRLTYYAKDTVNIRRGPGTNHDVVDQLSKGQEWRCYPKEAESKWIKCAEDEFIHASLLATSPPQSAASDVSQAECERRILAAEEAGIVVGYRVDATGAHVVVDESTWNEMPYTTKVGLTFNLECALIGPELSWTVYVHSDKTNKKLGKYSLNRLEVY